MVVEVKIDTDYMKRLKTDLDTGSSSKVLANALTLLRWAIDQKKQGRIIVSCTSDGQDAIRPKTQFLDGILPDPAKKTG